MGDNNEVSGDNKYNRHDKKNYIWHCFDYKLMF